ncbi:MAG TPA: hypothetical protein DCL06_06225 [Corynebacterium variabile]|uniref:Uncharacterized protein n=1 Tax=Corynebacterium variabile TaxID=1727 RepID=A0A3B9QU54_9CORY|nr:hypothetical protein [Corynebacterium variabile]
MTHPNTRPETLSEHRTVTRQVAPGDELHTISIAVTVDGAPLQGFRRTVAWTIDATEAAANEAMEAAIDALPATDNPGTGA